MSNSSSPQSHPPDEHVIKISHTSETTNSQGDSSSPTTFQVWFGQKVYPSLTPMRIFEFSVCLISSLLAFAFYSQTEFYKSSHYSRLLFVAALLCHTVWLFSILFFRFCTVSRSHYILKSIGEFGVLVLVSCLMLEIEHQNYHGLDEVFVFATCVFMDVDAICLTNLLTHGRHFSLLESIVTLTLHLGWLGSIYLRIFALSFVFLILCVKNFQWRHVGDADQATSSMSSINWVGLLLLKLFDFDLTTLFPI